MSSVWIFHSYVKLPECISGKLNSGWRFWTMHGLHSCLSMRLINFGVTRIAYSYIQSHYTTIHLHVWAVPICGWLPNIRICCASKIAHTFASYTVLCKSIHWFNHYFRSLLVFTILNHQKIVVYIFAATPKTDPFSPPNDPTNRTWQNGRPTMIVDFLLPGFDSRRRTKYPKYPV